MTDDVAYTDHDAPAEDGTAPEPRWDLLTEQSAIGGMLLDPRVIDDVMDELVPSDFYHPKHELIAKTIGSLHRKNLPTDVIAVTDELTNAGELRRAGGADYLHLLTGIVPTAANAGYYARLIKKLAVRRRLVEVGMSITSFGYASEGDSEELIEKARVLLDSVVAGQRVIVRPIGETFEELITALDTDPVYVPSPWESLDRLIGGFAPGALYVFAARPGAGKSIAALQIAASLARTGMVAVSSLEMTELELQTRLVAQFGPVHMTALRNHQLSNDDWKRVAEARSRVQGAPIFIDDTAGVTVAHIRSHARAVQRHGNLAGVIVDYLQLVDGEGQSRQEVVGGVAKALKHLAKDLGVPVIAAAQAKRSPKNRGARAMPDMDDLRESGDIENNADVIVFLDRDKEKTPDDVTMVVAKNRHGKLGQFRLRWQAEYARFLDRKWTPTALIDMEET
jgi:replicative DNA helicase